MLNIKVGSSLKKAFNVMSTLPSSKSFLNRALTLSAITPQRTILQNVNNPSDDVLLMMDAMRKIGVGVDFNEKKSEITVYGVGKNFVRPSDGIIDCGMAGTTSRFFVALSILFDFDVTITGTERILERPIYELVDVLVALGKEVKYLGREGSLPISVDGVAKIQNIEISCAKSSQFLTGLLMVANSIGISEISVKDDIVSKLYIDITTDIMKDFGLIVENKGYKSFLIKSNHANIKSVQDIESDWSCASYILSLGVLFGDVSIAGLKQNSSQPDSGFLNILEQVGAKVEWNGDVVAVTFNGIIKAINVDMSYMPDVSMTLMIIAAFADGKSKISGLKTLKDKESDRLYAMHTEFSKIGIQSKIDEDSIEIVGNPDFKLSKEIEIDTYNDHRIAMSFAIFGLKSGNITIKDAEVVRKSFPNFWQIIKELYNK